MSKDAGFMDMFRRLGSAAFGRAPQVAQPMRAIGMEASKRMRNPALERMGQERGQIEQMMTGRNPMARPTNWAANLGGAAAMGAGGGALAGVLSAVRSRQPQQPTLASTGGGP